MKPNDPQWKKDVEALVKVLKVKLTPDEQFELFRLVDADPPSGPLYDQLAQMAMKARPEEFEDDEEEKDE